MEMTSKQRAYLSSLASTITPIFQIGKASLIMEAGRELQDLRETKQRHLE